MVSCWCSIPPCSCNFAPFAFPLALSYPLICVRLVYALPSPPPLFCQDIQRVSSKNNLTSPPQVAKVKEACELPHDWDGKRWYLENRTQAQILLPFAETVPQTWFAYSLSEMSKYMPWERRKDLSPNGHPLLLHKEHWVYWFWWIPGKVWFDKTQRTSHICTCKNKWSRMWMKGTESEYLF